MFTPSQARTEHLHVAQRPPTPSPPSSAVAVRLRLLSSPLPLTRTEPLFCETLKVPHPIGLLSLLLEFYIALCEERVDDVRRILACCFLHRPPPPLRRKHRSLSLANFIVQIAQPCPLGLNGQLVLDLLTALCETLSASLVACCVFLLLCLLTCPTAGTCGSIVVTRATAERPGKNHVRDEVQSWAYTGSRKASH